MEQRNSIDSYDSICDLSEIYDVLDKSVWRLMERYEFELILEALSVKIGEVLKYNEISPEMVSQEILEYIESGHAAAKWKK